ncbi:hypothetical protein [Streptomyces sp. t39]|uniref:hypothetical protein n=1 Tax=Streptomyces sp. t39 TaxID=1828156 RepID=UPI0011CDDFA0|nr:hypothetical protein [Streptomyces sp. t39]TXS35053.1 hypothetical protein EAO77_37800 [Streptomyces sp. t39]
MVETFSPNTGDRIKVMRYRPDGRVHFVKTGTVIESYGYGFVFSEENGHSRRVHVASSESLAKGMPGWKQTIELA